ncbi:hypothetical protein [Lachnoclostridium phytofermentans]|nr:hypothetical protein [Lachnoclostridium phytofermentans]
MHMHLSTKKIAFSGLLLALTILFTILSSVFETSTFFFLAAASYLVGINFRESGVKFGIGFYLSAILLSIILVPNKLYCLTFATISAYIVIMEIIRVYLTKKELKKLATTNRDSIEKKSNAFFYSIKFVVFNVLYLPFLFLFPGLLYSGEISPMVYILFIIGGQIIFVIYDMAYDVFIQKYWKRIKKSIIRN